MADNQIQLIWARDKNGVVLPQITVLNRMLESVFYNRATIHRPARKAKFHLLPHFLAAEKTQATTALWVFLFLL